MQDFDTLVAEATEAAFAGWDFSWLDGRWIEGPIPWDYREYLRAIPWQIDGFSVEGYRDRLLALQKMMEREGGLMLHSSRFFIEAVRISLA